MKEFETTVIFLYGTLLFFWATMILAILFQEQLVVIRRWIIIATCSIGALIFFCIHYFMLLNSAPRWLRTVGAVIPAIILFITGILLVYLI